MKHEESGLRAGLPCACRIRASGKAHLPGPVRQYIYLSLALLLDEMPASTLEESVPQLSSDIERSLDRAVLVMKSLGKEDFINGELAGPASHLLGHPGKLLRPALVFIGAEAIGERPSEFIDLAVASELMHTSSLIHDDIIDGDLMRRGMPTVHKEYGSAAAILAGDALIAKAIEMAAPYGSRVLRHITRAAMMMCAGEALDYRCQVEGVTPTLVQYMEIARLKSAALIGASCSIAPVYKGSGIADRIYGLGEGIGIAFQIRDDMEDFVENMDMGDGTTGERMRPNIVTTLMEERSIGDGDALEEAARINNRCIDDACEGIEKEGFAAKFIEYSKSIRVRT